VNLQALRNFTRSLVSIASTDILSDADLNTFVNEAYSDILREADWPFNRNETTLTLVSGQAEYTLPAGITGVNIASVAVLSNDTNRRQLRPRNRYSTDDSPGPLSTGNPLEYSVYRNTVLFNPTPEASEVVTFRYFIQAPTLVSNTDLPVFDDGFHTVIAYGAAVRVLFREGDDTDRRAFYNQQFLRGVEQMKQYYLSERDRSIFRLGGRRRVFGRRDNTYGM
jgi:hypothetical protein